METENLLIICCTVFAMAFLGTIIYTSHTSKTQEHDRYNACIQAGHSWIPVENGMCLVKEMK